MTVTGTQQRVYGTLTGGCIINLHRFALVSGSTTDSPTTAVTVTYADTTPYKQCGYKYSGYLTLFLSISGSSVYAAVEVRICKNDAKRIVIETYGEVAKTVTGGMSLWFNKGSDKHFPTRDDFPETGSDNVNYIDDATGKYYIWNESSYEEGSCWVKLNSTTSGVIMPYATTSYTFTESKRNGSTTIDCCKKCPSCGCKTCSDPNIIFCVSANRSAIKYFMMDPLPTTPYDPRLIEATSLGYTHSYIYDIYDMEGSYSKIFGRHLGGDDGYTLKLYCSWKFTCDTITITSGRGRFDDVDPDKLFALSDYTYIFYYSSDNGWILLNHGANVYQEYFGYITKPMDYITTTLPFDYLKNCVTLSGKIGINVFTCDTSIKLNNCDIVGRNVSYVCYYCGTNYTGTATIVAHEKLIPPLLSEERDVFWLDDITFPLPHTYTTNPWYFSPDYINYTYDGIAWDDITLPEHPEPPLYYHVEISHAPHMYKINMIYNQFGIFIGQNIEFDYEITCARSGTFNIVIQYNNTLSFEFETLVNVHNSDTTSGHIRTLDYGFTPAYMWEYTAEGRQLHLRVYYSYDIEYPTLYEPVSPIAVRIFNIKYTNQLGEDIGTTGIGIPFNGMIESVTTLTLID